jgi:hypothetical protein
MLREGYIIEGNYKSNLYQSENIWNFNRQIIDDFNRKIEALESELLILTAELEVEDDVICQTP